MKLKNSRSAPPLPPTALPCSRIFWQAGPTEIEALNAQVATRGRTLGLATPVNVVLTRLIHAAEQSSQFRVS